jgi:hypothetical protein
MILTAPKPIRQSASDVSAAPATSAGAFQSEPYDWQPPPKPGPPKPDKKQFSLLALGLTALVALVVGSLLGAVGYSSSRRTATVAA